MAWWLEIPTETAILVSTIITIGLILNYYLKFLPAVENIERQSYGTIAYGLSVTILIAQFWSHNPAVVCVGVLVMAIGDGLAGLIGKHYQSFSWQLLGQNKSVAGTLTMFLGSTLILLMFTSINNIELYPLAILAIALLATALEQISPFGIDNITVPIGVSVFWNWMIAN